MVKAWSESVVIPTYEIGAAERNPIFLEKRVYQGSSGVVYPYPVVESISDKPVDYEWQAVWLENEYIKVMILPELGGRVQMAYDKIKQRHFVYYNHVIKPALVGLTGPWISGGIEFNWPQHHRPSTYLPVDWRIEEHADGSATVWVNEQERMFHQKGAAGFTLRPGHAYLEIRGRLYNATPLPQTFLWWANPAVHVNEHYQSVFPQDINAVFDHGKRAVSSFPIATGTYYKMDYSAGVDISNYKNIKVPTSYMGVNSSYNFEGGYENDTHGGMLHVASHHVSPGKKQWTWGNGDFGRAWDRNLTDADGPYIELMAGVFTENQPDFTWLMPYEEKRFTQYFMPYRELGVVKNASKDLLLNITEEPQGKARLMVYATSRRKIALKVTSDEGKQLYANTVVVSPEALLDEVFPLSDVQLCELSVEIFAADDCPQYTRQVALLTWHSEADELRPIPDAAEAALRPEEIKTNDELYLTGLHLEQYRHATYHAPDYYEEALRRDPLDYRCNNQLGLWYLRRGRFERAEEYLRRAVKVLRRRNPNPYDGEPLYLLAQTLRYQGKIDEAYELFWKATWNKAWQDAAWLECARISLCQHRVDDALEELDNALIANGHNHKALTLRAVALRLAEQYGAAKEAAGKAVEIDGFNYTALNELYLLTGDAAWRQQMGRLMHGAANNFDELALDYLAAGQQADALDVLQWAVDEGATTPMTYYYMGLAGSKEGFDLGSKACPDYCFPNRLEDVVALRAAIACNGDDGFAHYYLGCLYYGARQYEVAEELWQKACELIPQYATLWRNRALYAFNKAGDALQATALMERAFALDEHDARLLMELDQLYKRLGHSHEERLERLCRYPELIAQRDDLLLEQITLLNQTGSCGEALRLIGGHHFHPWEGGEGKVTEQYQYACVQLAKEALRQGDAPAALERLEAAVAYPEQLGEGRLENAQENDIYYYMGMAQELMGRHEEAMDCWQRAACGESEPAPAMYYNDAKADKIFYQGMALRRMGRTDEANGRFYKLINYGKQHVFDEVRMDYFAVSLPDLQIWESDLTQQNRDYCYYLLALGYYGLGDMAHARKYYDKSADSNSMGMLELGMLLSSREE